MSWKSIGASRNHFEAEDCQHPLFSIECKHRSRQNYTARLRDWFEQARAGRIRRQRKPGTNSASKMLLIDSSSTKSADENNALDSINSTGLCCIDMAWTVPKYSKNQLDAAGDSLVHLDELTLSEQERTLAVIDNWRSSHSFPLNTFQVGLRRRAKYLVANALIAQRIKRLSSIKQKLGRFNTMKFSRMQDIGGCRAVVSTVQHVERLVRIYKNSDIKHKLVREDDYIRKPKSSGYRGVHLIYRYYSDRNETYNGLQIEMQLRSSLQHVWATAVETVGTFLKQALKSSQGEEDWLRFFALMATDFAMREKTAIVPNTPSNKDELVAELRRIARKLEVETRLKAYTAAVQTLERAKVENAHYYLLALDPIAKKLRITTFEAKELQKATEAYLATERAFANKPGDAVLVSVESLASLRRAYPNYFLDTRAFIEAVNQAIG